MASDWEEVEDSEEQAPVPAEQKPQSATLGPVQSDWEEATEPAVTPKYNPKETLGTSVSFAVPRVLGDVLKGSYQTLANVPHYYNVARQAIPALGQEIWNRPVETAQQFKGGLAEQGQKLFTLPHDVVNYLSQRLNLVPENVNKIVQMSRMPEENQYDPVFKTTNAINKTFGEPQNLGQQAARFAGRNIENLTAATAASPNVYKAARGGIELMRKPVTNESTARMLQQGHDRILNLASDDFNHVANEVTRRGAETVHSPAIQSLVDQASQYLSRSRNTQRLLNDARTGNFHALRDLQSDLFNRANKALNSPLQADINAGEEMHDIRSQINDELSNHLINTGNEDLNARLNLGRYRYRYLQQTYHEGQHPAIKKLVNLDRRERIVPNNVFNVLSENSGRMNRLLRANPGVSNALNRYNIRNNAMNALKSLATKGLIGSAITAAGPLYQIGAKYLSKEGQ